MVEVVDQAKSINKVSERADRMVKDFRVKKEMAALLILM